MSLQERIDKLEPRERRLLGVLGGIFSTFVILAGPFGLWSYVSGKRAENQDLRDTIDAIYEARTTIADKKAKRDAIIARYARPAPQLAPFIEEAGKENGMSAGETQDAPEIPHGKRYAERTTKVRFRKIHMLALAKTLEKIEQSGYPVTISRLNVKPHGAGEADSYEVELAVTAFDRKVDAPPTAPNGSAAASRVGAARHEGAVMKERLLRVGKILVYPAFYMFCLALFGYLKFPFDRVKDRVIAEAEKGMKPGQRLEIGKLSSYWFTGVELESVKLHMPPSEPARPAFPGAEAPPPPKESVVVIDEAHVRVRMLPLLIGRVRVDFWASAFGGEITGNAPVGNAKAPVELNVDHVDLGHIEALSQMLPVPIRGIATAKLSLEAVDGKFSKANGSFDLTVSNVVVSDGKTKIAGLLELPAAKLGDLVVSAEAKDGVLKISKLTANGSDLEIIGDGRITLREPPNESLADLWVRFKFTDAYRGRDKSTKALLGDPSGASHGIIDTAVPEMIKARRPDGFYGFHVTGPLKKVKYEPTTLDGGPPVNAGASPVGPLNKRPMRGSPAAPPPPGNDKPPPPLPPPTPGGPMRRLTGPLSPPPPEPPKAREEPPPPKPAEPPPPAPVHNEPPRNEPPPPAPPQDTPAPEAPPPAAE